MADNNIANNLASVLEAAVDLINQATFSVRGDKADLISVTVARARGAAQDLRTGKVLVSLAEEAVVDAAS